MSHFYTQKSNLSNVIVIQDRIFLFVFIDAGTVWLLQGEDLCQSSIGYLNHIAPSFPPITRRQNFRLVQIETNCRQHFKVLLKWKISTI